jgi:hypothetical protein
MTGAKDLDGNPRIWSPSATVDMGCYEFIYSPVLMLAGRVAISTNLVVTVVTNLAITNIRVSAEGTLSPNVRGDYLYGGEYNGYNYYSSTNGYFIYSYNPGFVWFLHSSLGHDASGSFFALSSDQPIGTYAPDGATGTPTAVWGNIVTNSTGSNSTNIFISGTGLSKIMGRAQ